MKAMEKIGSFFGRFMALIVLAVAALALFVPQSSLWIDTKWVNYLLMVIMFGMGLTMKPKDFAVVITHPKEIIIGCAAQFIIMPLLAFALSKIFNLDPALTAGVVLVGTCPGGTASNVITYFSKGDVALSVGMTSVNTLFPIALGLIISKLFPRFVQKIVPLLPAVSTVGICMIVATVVSHNAEKIYTSGIVVLAVVILHNLLGYGCGFGIGKLFGMTPEKTKALSIEIGMQNSGLATSLANTAFPDPSMAMATVPGALFSVWHNISGAVLAAFYRKWNSKK